MTKIKEKNKANLVIQSVIVGLIVSWIISLVSFIALAFDLIFIEGAGKIIIFLILSFFIIVILWINSKYIGLEKYITTRARNILGFFVLFLGLMMLLIFYNLLVRYNQSIK